MGNKKYLMIEVTANQKNGNPYHLIETEEWKARTVYYIYLDSDGNTIGRQKKLNISCGQSIPSELKDDIEGNDIVKISWNAAQTRIFLSKILNYPSFKYLSCDSWIDVQVIVRMNGNPTKSFTNVAQIYSVKQKSQKEKDRFAALISIVKQLTKQRCINLSQMAGYTNTQKLNDKGINVNKSCLESGIKLIELYRDSIDLSAKVEDHRTTKNKIINYFSDKYGTKKSQEIYNLIEITPCLTKLEILLICKLKFLNCSTVYKFMRISENLCSYPSLTKT